MKRKSLKTINKELKSMRAARNNTSDSDLKSLFIIIGVIIVLLAIIYGLTELLNKKDNSSNKEVAEVSINYDKTIIGTLLNRPYDNYYVMIYNGEDSNSIKYATLISSYSNAITTKERKKIYFCDLANELNSAYYNVGNDGKSNPNAKAIKDLDLGDLTLIEVKNKQIVNYVEGYEKIKKILN